MERQQSEGGRVRTYLIMRANAQEALRLAEEWWARKVVPDYIHVRSLRRDEIPKFVSLYNQCFLASPDPFCPVTVEQVEELDLEGMFVAEMWGSLVGFITCFVEHTGDTVYGEITSLCVVPSRRRRGVATALIMRATEFFIDAGVEEVYCEVYEENTPSKLLVLSYGFEVTGHHEIRVEGSTVPDGGRDEMPGGKLMRRVGVRPRAGCTGCRDM